MNSLKPGCLILAGAFWLMLGGAGRFTNAQEAKPPPTQPGALPAGLPPSQPATEPAAQAEMETEITLELGRGARMKLALVPAGKFWMGSPTDEKGRLPNEGPDHEVAITKPFYIGMYEVTQGQYQAVTGNNPSAFPGATNPVEMVSWEDAVEFCKKASKRSGWIVRLPTEAEWEYACRGNSLGAYCNGNTVEDLKKVGWCTDTAGRGGAKSTKPVGSLLPNAYGLFDMHGNVWEWCSDRYDANFYANSKGVPDPQGPAAGNTRVLRGGCWANTAVYCRSAYRLWSSPVTRHHSVGFRVVAVK